MTVMESADFISKIKLSSNLYVILDVFQGAKDLKEKQTKHTMMNLVPAANEFMIEFKLRRYETILTVNLHLIQICKLFPQQ